MIIHTYHISYIPHTIRAYIRAKVRYGYSSSNSYLCLQVSFHFNVFGSLMSLKEIIYHLSYASYHFEYIFLAGEVERLCKKFIY